MNYETTQNILLIIQAGLKIAAGMGASCLILCFALIILEIKGTFRKV